LLSGTVPLLIISGSPGPVSTGTETGTDVLCRGGDGLIEVKPGSGRATRSQGIPGRECNIDILRVSADRDIKGA
jgi:hypothetical protein